MKSSWVQNSFEVDCSKLSFFWRWVYTWTFVWPISYRRKNQSSKLDLQNFGFIISKWMYCTVWEGIKCPIATL